ncbi:hypothetical protein SADUNF_Sadunf10G0135400 [Salix dunnii]|uniref:Uncharacterized protein n=1 Tax=Salix dunnii TaxID=1413687 RepID=A0A835JR99_9ROSI|nr:hypothetical protein SADUNF_Sadunf10G0135400 [Salix dunnii]
MASVKEKQMSGQIIDLTNYCPAYPPAQSSYLGSYFQLMLIAENSDPAPRFHVPKPIVFRVPFAMQGTKHSLP